MLLSQLPKTLFYHLKKINERLYRLLCLPENIYFENILTFRQLNDYLLHLSLQNAIRMELITLLNLYKSKPQTVQRQLYDLLYRRCFAVCCRYINQEQDREEALDNGLLKVFAHISKGDFEHEGAFYNWVSNIQLGSTYN